MIELVGYDYCTQIKIKNNSFLKNSQIIAPIIVLADEGYTISVIK
jgi:hypothetical protein